MKLSEEIESRLRAIDFLSSDVFSDIVIASGLDPTRDFVSADLSGVDFRGSDLRHFDLSYADLRRCSWDVDFGGLEKFSFALRGRGDAAILPRDFEPLVETVKSGKTWSDRFFAFSLIVDSFGETTKVLRLLTDILEREKSTYMPVCSYVYLSASFCRAGDAQDACLAMAERGNAYYNMYRLDRVQRYRRELTSYIERVSPIKRFPEELNPLALAEIGRRFF